MEKVPIFEYIPPVKFYDELKIDEAMIIDKFIGLIERLYGSLSPVGGLHNNWISFYLWICEVIKNKGVKAVYIFGSSVYRMDNPYDITDIDMFISTRDGIKIHVPSELREEILHIQMLSRVLFTYEICGLSQQLLVLKTSEETEKMIQRAREIFNENYLFALIVRDVYKVCATKKVSDSMDEELKNKIMMMKLNDKVYDQENPYFVRTILKDKKVKDDEFLTLVDFSLKRRRVKKEYGDRIRNQAEWFWKTGRW